MVFLGLMSVFLTLPWFKESGPAHKKSKKWDERGVSVYPFFEFCLIWRGTRNIVS